MPDIKTKDGIIIKGVPEDVMNNPTIGKQIVASVRSSKGPGVYDFNEVVQDRGSAANEDYSTPVPETEQGIGSNVMGGGSAVEVPEQNIPPGVPGTDAAGVVGAMHRGLSPTLMSGIAGGAVGSVVPGVGTAVGAGGGILAYTGAKMVLDPLTKVVNKQFGTDFATPTEAMNELFTRMGVAEPDSETEKLIQQISENMAAATTPIAAGTVMQGAGGLGKTVMQGAGKMLAAKGTEQIAGAAGSTVGTVGMGKLADSIEAGPKTKMAMQAAGGLAGDLAAGGIVSGPARIARAKGLSISPDKASKIEVIDKWGKPATTAEAGGIITQKATSKREARVNMPDGLGEKEFARNLERQKNLKVVLDDYDVDIDQFSGTNKNAGELLDDFIKVRKAKLDTNVKAKKEIIEKFKGEKVNTPKTSKYLEDELAEIVRLNITDLPEAGKLSKEITRWDGALQNLDLKDLEKTRKILLDSLDAKGNEGIAKEGKKILDGAYKMLVEDMGDFITEKGTKKDFVQWKVANKHLSNMAQEFGEETLSKLLKQKDLNPDLLKPEVITDILYKGTKSDNSRLYRRLSPKGRKLVKTSLMAKFIDENSIDDVMGMSPSQFSNSMRKYSDQLGIFTDAGEGKRLASFKKYLDATRGSENTVRAAKGLAPISTNIAPGTGPIIAGAARKSNPFLWIASALSIEKGIGTFAKFYDSPKVRNLLLRLSEIPKDSNAYMETIKRIDRVAKTIEGE